jgi:cardiolipin synthase A/B
VGAHVRPSAFDYGFCALSRKTYLAMADGHQVQLLQGASEFFPALVAAMDSAQNTIRLETYIFDVTGTGAQVATALAAAASRGVKVQLVVDGAGTGELPLAWRERFDAAGVQWQVFNPLGSWGLLRPSGWRRLHRKLCVVDGGSPSALAFCGGINILDDYHDPNHGALTAPRFDFAVRVSGPLVNAVSDATGQLWQRMLAVRQLRGRALPQAWGTWRSAGGAWSALARSSVATDPNALSLAGNELGPGAMLARAALLLRDNLLHRKNIEKAYLKAIGEARHEVIIANAYFLPGGKLRKAIIAAAQRGVKVKLLLQGRYEYFMQYHAARPVYSALLQSGVEIHEYAASFLHAKVAVVDAADPAKAWATVGSSNLDPLSLLLAREANVVVHGNAFAQALRAKLVYAMEHDGKPLDPAVYANRPGMQRLLDHVGYAAMRVALWLTGKHY